MAHTIWKFGFTVTDEFTLPMPQGARLLDVQTQGGEPQLWALVDPDAPRARRRFRLYGTGHPMDAPDLPHVGTFQMHVGALVFHLFDGGES